MRRGCGGIGPPKGGVLVSLISRATVVGHVAVSFFFFPGLLFVNQVMLLKSGA